MATLTGRTARSISPSCDTPGFPPRNPGSPDGLSRAELARAVPAGSRCVRSQREALRGGLACPDLGGVRADFREHLAAWWRIHVNHASWGGEGRPPRGTTEPTRARVCELGGMSVTTYKRCSRWWRARGYAAVARPGWTPLLRPGALVSPDDRNERQVLVLCLPRRSKPATPPPVSAPAVSGPLSGSRRELDKAPRAREAKPEDKPGKPEKPRKDRAPRGLPVLPRPGRVSLAATPQNRSEALTAAAAVQEHLRLLRKLSAEHLRHLARPFFAAGWTPADLVHAIDHDTRGRQHGYSAGVRSPAGWIRARLTAWLGPDGIPLPSRSQQAVAARRRVLAEQSARRARDTAGRAQVADYPAQAARAREMLMRTRGARTQTKGVSFSSSLDQRRQRSTV